MRDGWMDGKISWWLRRNKRYITMQVNDQSLFSKRVKDHKPIKEDWDLEIQTQGTGFYSEGRQKVSEHRASQIERNALG